MALDMSNLRTLGDTIPGVHKRLPLICHPEFDL